MQNEQKQPFTYFRIHTRALPDWVCLFRVGHRRERQGGIILVERAHSTPHRCVEPHVCIFRAMSMNACMYVCVFMYVHLYVCL
jgi:hypothetical protein